MNLAILTAAQRSCSFYRLFGGISGHRRQTDTLQAQCWPSACLLATSSLCWTLIVAAARLLVQTSRGF